MEELSSKKLMQYDVVLMTEIGVRQLHNYVRQCRKTKVNFASKKKIYSFDIEEIYYIEADMRAVIIHLKEDEFVLQVLISETEQMLKDYPFMRVHRSYIVNALHIRRLSKKNVVLDNGVKLDVSRYRYDEVWAAYLELTESVGAVSVISGKKQGQSSDGGQKA